MRHHYAVMLTHSLAMPHHLTWPPHISVSYHGQESGRGGGEYLQFAMSSLEKEIVERWTGNEPHTYRARIPRQANCTDLATSCVRIEK